jgi:phosphomannomutase / phosphoglucomutase
MSISSSEPGCKTKKSIWGAYDIRAVVGDSFNEKTYRQIGKAYAKFLLENLPVSEPIWVSVGRDARLHSPLFADALIEGLTSQGINVMKLGMSTSPIVYFADFLYTLNASFPELSASMVVTASHNPSEYNGLKFTYQKRSLQEEELKEVHRIFDQLPEIDSEPAVQQGQVREFSIIPDYLNWMEKHFGQLGAGLKVVVDSGNATAGIVAPDLLRRLGCEVVELFTEPDGTFPNHHPDPCVHKNLKDLEKTVLQTGADVGFAFDGDSDRVGIIDNKGNILPGDYIMLYLAEALLQTQSGSTILLDIKSSHTVYSLIKAQKGHPMLIPSGHAFMKRVMKEQDIPLGGELSGHIFFRDRHWGFDDALYAACRVLEVLAAYKKQNPAYHLSEFYESVPPSHVSEEGRVYCSAEDGQQLIASLKNTLESQPAFFGPRVEEVLTLDGLRANFEDGFFLLRPSKTEPCLTLRYGASSAEAYAQIAEKTEELTAPLKAKTKQAH